MKYLLFVLLFVVNSQVMAHDLSMAHFKFHAEADGYLYLDIRVIQEDFKLALTNNGQCSYNSEEVRDKLIVEYLKEHVDVSWNNMLQKFTVIDVSEDEHRFYIKIRFEGRVKGVNSIQLENTFLLATKEQQVNVIELHFNDRIRGFKMSKERIKILAEY